MPASYFLVGITKLKFSSLSEVHPFLTKSGGGGGAKDKGSAGKRLSGRPKAKDKSKGK